MATTKAKHPSMPVRQHEVESSALYEAETLALQSLRLIAAPNPQDDLSDEQLAELVRKPGQNSALVKHLIEYIKKL